MKLWTVTVEESNISFINNLRSSIHNLVALAIEEQSKIIAEEIKRKYFTSSMGMYSKGSDLEKTIHPVPVISTGDDVIGGISLGDSKTAKFVSKSGEPIVIRPKKAKALAVPLSREAYDIQKGVSSLRGISTLTRRKGYLFDKNRNGAPLFALRKSVTIKPKIATDEIVSEYTLPITVAVQNAIFKALRGV